MHDLLQTLNIGLGLVALAAVACRVALCHVVSHGHGWLASNAWALAHTLIGMGLFGYVLSAMTEAVIPELARSAFLVGLAILLAVRWRRRKEESPQ